MTNIQTSNNKLKILFLTLILFISIFIVNPTALSAAETEIEVTTYNDLVNEVNSASTDPDDHKTIVIDGLITMPNTLNLLPNTHITLTAKQSGSGLLAGMHDYESMINVPQDATLTIGKDVEDNALIIDANSIVGGALVHNSGNLILNSGYITGATGLVAATPGGGVYNSGLFTMNGGSISQNEAYGMSWGNGGGAVFTEGTFIMNGGEMEDNRTWGVVAGEQKGGVGGAIFVKAGDATINGGHIHNNQAASGGAIYVYGSVTDPTDFATLALKSSIITSNLAEESGGGVWLCQTGLTLSHSTLGTTVIDNSVADDQTNSKVGGDDYYSEVKYNSGYVIKLPERTLSGTALEWYTDKPQQRYDYNNVRDMIKNGDIVTDDELYLHTESQPHVISDVMSKASVIIEDNYAINGGGIAANGVVTFGIPDEDVDFSVNKKWEDGSTSHSAIEVQLIQYIDTNGNGILEDDERINPVKIDGIVELDDANNWSYQWTSLPKYINNGSGTVEYLYDVEEISALNGYESSKSQIEFDPSTREYAVTITNTELMDLEGTKTWEHGSNPVANQPTELAIIISANGTPLTGVSPVWSKSGDVWTYTFKDLPKYENGVEIVYTVEETAVPGYTGVQNGLNFKNTFVEAVIDIVGTKTWEHGSNPLANQPTELAIIISANGTPLTGVSPVWSKSGDVWTYTFKDLPKYENGVEIVYTVEETAVPGYTGVQNGLNFKNTFVEPLIKIQGSKIWNDNDNKKDTRPQNIVVVLKANGEKIDEISIEESDNWTYSFNQLKQYDENHRLIHYTIEEVSVKGYKTTYDGFDIINTLETTPDLPSTGVSSNFMNYGAVLLVGVGLMLIGGIKKKEH